MVMGEFFLGSRPGREVRQGNATFELPILYFRDDLFGLFFAADYERAKSLMPSDKLHPVSLLGRERKAIVGIFAFNYLETSIGPYGEVGVVIPTVYGEKAPLPVVPGVLEARYPGFGNLVLHLPVTNQTARDAGRGQWGYTKFVGDMIFTNTAEYYECNLSEKDKHILTIRAGKKGIVSKDTKPLITYSVKDNELIKTVIPNQGICRNEVNPKIASLELGDHEVSDSIRDLGLSPKPFLTRSYVERCAILPAGEVIEEDVRPLEGYFGKNRKGKHETHYLPE